MPAGRSVRVFISAIMENLGRSRAECLRILGLEADLGRYCQACWWDSALMNQCPPLITVTKSYRSAQERREGMWPYGGNYLPLVNVHSNNTVDKSTYLLVG